MNLYDSLVQYTIFMIYLKTHKHIKNETHKKKLFYLPNVNLFCTGKFL